MSILRIGEFWDLWVVLIPPLHPYLLLSLIPTPVLYCAVLMSRSQNKYVSPRQELPCLHQSPSPATPRSFSLRVLTKNPWLAPRLPSCRCLRHTYLLPYLLGFHTWGVVMSNSCLSGLASSTQHTSRCVVLQFQSSHQPSKIRPKNYSLHSKYLKDIQ